MTQDELRRLLKKVWAQKLDVEDALQEIKLAPTEKLTHSRVDHQRALRCGFPEVIFCQGKQPDDIREIAAAILREADVLLATRADVAAFEAIQMADARAVYHERARCVSVVKKEPEARSGRILVVTAGTADVPVAEEARVTAELTGHRVETLYDVGVAGIHRLLEEVGAIHKADVIVVAAGMEGALASVVGGLAACPVIAVPTSVGYGASFGGIAPLLTMLNSCAAGVGVVNIDNGFGAGYLAGLVARKREDV